MANFTGWGGRRPGAGGKPVPLRRELAERRLRIIERGIAGDLDGSMPEDVRRQIAEARIVEYLHQMQVGRWPELVPMYLGAMEAAQELPSEQVSSGVSSLLAALDHRQDSALDVPELSQSEDDEDRDQAQQGTPTLCTPDVLSGARLPILPEVGPTGVGIQSPLPLAAPVGSAFSESFAPGRGRDDQGAPLPPSRAPRESYVVDSQNLDFSDEAA